MDWDTQQRHIVMCINQQIDTFLVGFIFLSTGMTPVPNLLLTDLEEHDFVGICSLYHSLTVNKSCGLSQYKDAWVVGWGCLSTKMLMCTLFYQSRDPHDKDKTISQLSYLYLGNPYTRRDGLYIETGYWFLEVTLTKNNTSWTYIANPCSPFYKHGLTLILAWINNYILYNMLDEITYPFPNFNGCAIEVWELINNFVPHFWVYDFLSMLGIQLNHVSKRSPWPHTHMEAKLGDHCKCRCEQT